MFGLLGWRLFCLQHYRYDYYRQTSRRQQHAVVTEKPQRGIIVDRRGRILAASNKTETVFAEPGAMANVEIVKEASEKLQQILNIGGHEICRP